jgi:acyl-CoA reductase-like NAD-dependent aldehyde dehydrogenase
MGDLRDPDTWLGPIISERQRNRVRTHIEDARSKGANVVTGGDWDGNRCHPTILTDVQEDMVVCREETFGPVTSIYPVDSAEEALEKANDTAFGLSAAVFTQDIDQALTLAQSINAGMVHINAPTLNDEPHVPFGGMGESGFGREGTDIDIDTLTEWKWITVQLPVSGDPS